MSLIRPAMKIGAFSHGNGIRAAVCGEVTDAGFDWTAVPLARATLLLIEWLRRGARRSVAVGVVCGCARRPPDSAVQCCACVLAVRKVQA